MFYFQYRLYWRRNENAELAREEIDQDYYIIIRLFLFIIVCITVDYILL